MTRKARPRKRPCATCPYRRDVPSAIWSAEEYDRLPGYDLDTGGQAEAGAVSVLFCHQATGHVCAGWAGCHDMPENLAIRLTHRILDIPALLAYISPVPLFSSGKEAAEHGKRDIGHPTRRALAAQAKVVTARQARGQPVQFERRRTSRR